jgi:NAD-specific glutamate dehydrogenase
MSSAADPRPDILRETGPSPEAVDDLCDHLRDTQEGDVSLLCDFTRRFFSKVPRQLVEERSREDSVGTVCGASGSCPSPGSDPVRVQILNPADEGWSAPATVIRTLVEDRPFIVDTIREFLGAEKILIEYLRLPASCAWNVTRRAG